MKKLINNLLVIFILFLSINSFAQVGIGTTDPNTSSMLDIQSTTKGVLIPRMLTSERTAIASPANGLLVFDNTTKSFWFYNGTATTPAWKELVSGSSIVDADGDTKIQVEKTADEDKIRLSTANAAGTASVERMTIDKTGVTKIGVDLAAQATTYVEIGADGVIKLGNQGASTLTAGPLNLSESDVTTAQNYTRITADGSLSYVGNATRWEDLKVPVNSVKIKDKKAGVNIIPAEWEDFIGETGLLWFDDVGNVDDEQSVTFTVQLPHAWKEGSPILPHVHWSAKVAPNNERVYWALEYSWASLTDIFPSTTTIRSNTAVSSGSIDAFEHVLTPLGSIDATDKTLSSMLVCRLYRNSSNGLDTFNGEKAGLLEIDFHYQVDSAGSNQEYTKQN